MLSLSLLADTTWYPVTFDSPLNIARGVFFWLTIALLLACGVFFSIVKFLLKRELGRGLRYLGIGAVAYACLVGIVLLLLTFLEDGIEALLFYPLLALVLAVGGSGIALFFRRNKTVYIVCGCVVGAALIAALVCMGVLFASGDSLLNNWILTDDESADFSKVDQIGLYISAALLVAGIIAATFLLGKDEPKGFDAKSISFAGVAIAMSFALSYLRIVKMPQGGSITVASLLPLMIYSYMFGVKKGVFAGMIYGLLQAVQDPYILHPAQYRKTHARK